MSRISINSHQKWRESLAGGPAFDPDEALLEEIPQPTQRRKEAELARLMATLDELQQSERREA